MEIRCRQRRDLQRLAQMALHEFNALVDPFTRVAFVMQEFLLVTQNQSHEMRQ